VPRIDAWSLLARARAIENQAWLVGANSTGASNGTPLGGRTLVVSPWGEATELAEPGVLSSQLDPDLPRRAREAFPVLRDRRL
jgi:predicted amidohydrolase